MTQAATSTANSPYIRFQQRQRREARFAVISFVIIAAAWLFGYATNHSEIAPLVQNVMPGTNRVEEQGGIYLVFDEDNALLGYAAAKQSSGYGGPILMLVGTDLDGQIIGVQVVEQHETPGFFNWLRRDDFFNQFLGLQPDDSLTLGDGVDGVTGATLSSEAVARSIRQAVQTIHTTQSPEPRPLAFGWPEVTLLGLFVSGFITSRHRNSRLKRWVRWIMLLVGIFVLGFVFNKPLTLAHFTSLLAGYWPDWHTNLYWYLLLGGVVLATLWRGKNPYCSWFCPFGGVQECLGVIGGAKPYRSHRRYVHLRQFQRWLALIAIALGLAFRQPPATSYEPFGTLFAFNGGFFPWMFLVIILFSSLIIQRPFCTYLCPIDPAIGFVRRIRMWILTLWKRLNPNNNAKHPGS